MKKPYRDVRVDHVRETLLVGQAVARVAQEEMMTNKTREHIESYPIGSWQNPVMVDGPLERYPEEFKDRPYIYAIPKDGVATKWYRSYADYCDD